MVYRNTYSKHHITKVCRIVRECDQDSAMELKTYSVGEPFSQHGPEAMVAIAFTRRLSLSSAAASTIVEVFETIIATGLKSYEYV